MKIVDMKMDDVEVLRKLIDLLEHQHVIREVVSALGAA
jgi:hypothetical protein